MSLSEASSADKGIRKQPSLPRQGSLTIPAPLCGKTVDEVWSEIHKGQQSQQQHQQQHQNKSSNSNNGSFQNTEPAPRQPTFGEMTLEDFLVKAGVVREPCAMPAVPASHHHHHPQQHQNQYGVYTSNNSAMAPSSFVGRPVVGGGGVGNVAAPPPYQAVAQGAGEPSGYAGNGGKRDGAGAGGYPPPPPASGVCFGGRVVNGGGGYGVGSTPTMGIAGGPLSPASSDGVGTGEGQFGVEMGVLRGRKRMVDGPVEKVVERRQRRMIKNRESAARSRARKQVHA